VLARRKRHRAVGVGRARGPDLQVWKPRVQRVCGHVGGNVGGRVGGHVGFCELRRTLGRDLSLDANVRVGVVVLVAAAEAEEKQERRQGGGSRLEHDASRRCFV